MEQSQEVVLVMFTVDQASEILNRCLESSGDDTPTFREALQTLAWALKGHSSSDQERTA